MTSSASSSAVAERTETARLIGQAMTRAPLSQPHDDIDPTTIHHTVSAEEFGMVVLQEIRQSREQALSAFDRLLDVSVENEKMKSAADVQRLQAEVLVAKADAAREMCEKVCKAEIVAAKEKMVADKAIHDKEIEIKMLEAAKAVDDKHSKRAHTVRVAGAATACGGLGLAAYGVMAAVAAATGIGGMVALVSVGAMAVAE